MLTHNVKHYLDFISGSDHVNTFCWMNDSTSKVITGRSCVYGSFKDIIKWEQELQREGVKLPTLHMALNETDLEGRRTPNIKAYRVLVVDLDRPVNEKELLSLYKKYSVHLVVRSSPEKYHLYWQLERGSDLDVWKKLQIGMAHKLEGDMQLSLPTSLIRVPGFPRIAKDGKQTMPAVMTFQDENKVKPISIKKFVKMFPWIWEEAAAGEKLLKKQRKDAAKIAHEMMKARGTAYDPAKFARMTPNIGRNNTLYLALCEIVYTHEDDLMFDEVLSYAEDLNQSFKTPLGQAEVLKTVHSAFDRSKRARAKKIREQAKILKTLEKKSADEQLKTKKELEQEVEKTVVSTILGKEQKVPESYLDIAELLINNVWTGTKPDEQLLNHNILASAYKAKYYQKLTDFLVRKMKMCGAFKVSGYSVYLRGQNESGEEVRYRKNLDSESLSALLQEILQKLYLYAVKVSMNGHKGRAESEGLISHLEQRSTHAKEEKTKVRKNKNAKASKVQRDKTNGRGDDQEDASGASTENTVT